jgi:hypothetical protein
VPDDQVGAQRLAQDGVESSVIRAFVGPIEDLVGQVAQAERKAVPEDLEQAKDQVRAAGRIRIVFVDR